MADQRTPPSGFYSYNAARSAPPISHNAYHSAQGPPMPMAYAASPMTFGYNYSSNPSSGSASAWSTAHFSTGVPQYAYPTMPMSNVSNGANMAQTQQLQKQRKTWTCDACDVTLDSERALKAHRKSHVKCTECSFEGVPKVVKAHYQANHGKFSGSGFKTVTVAIPGCRAQRFRICVGNRPEDIQKWIADRKKRFPRSQKVEQTKADNSASTKATSGLSSLLGGYGSSSESEDENPEKMKDEKKDSIQKEPEQTSPGQLTESNEAPKTTTSLNPRIPPSRNSRPCRYFMKNGKCFNGDACRFSHDLSNQPRQRLESRKRKRGKSSSNNTLLRKLLSNDMDREESLALQLLEQIFDSKFFDGEHGRSQRS